MKKVEFTCKTITPMFCYGADQNSPEIRAASIKGALRFWWRALHPDLTLEELKKKEAEIFGGINKGEGKSKVIVRVEVKSKRVKSDFRNEIPHTKVIKAKGYGYNFDKKYAGLLYLYYPQIMLEENCNYIDINSEFTITLNLYYEDYQQIYQALCFLSLMGGIGARSRRGAGSFKIVNSTCDVFCAQYLEKANNITNLKEFQSHLCTLIPSIQIKNKNYSILKNSEIHLVQKEFSSWKNALTEIGGVYKDFRYNNRHKKEETPMFGFPVLKNRGALTMGAGKLESEDNEYKFLDRRASPLLFKVFQKNNNRFYSFVIKLNGKFLPGEFKITDKNATYFADQNPAIVDDFLTSIDNKRSFAL